MPNKLNQTCQKETSDNKTSRTTEEKMTELENEVIDSKKLKIKP